MAVNLDIIRSLDSDKKYYRSSTTGEIKEASFWLKCKCFFGVKSALLKVTNLVESVRTSLLKEAGMKSNAALDEYIRQSVNLNSSVKGSVLKDIVTRFAVADETAIVKNKAGKAIENSVRSAVRDIISSKPNIGDSSAISRIFSFALKPALNGNIPVVREEGKQTKLNTTKFVENSIKPLKNDVSNLLLEISQNTKLGNPKIDKLYAKHIMATLFNADGTRNEKGIDALKTPDQVRMEHVYQLEDDTTRSSDIYKKLKKKDIDPLAKLNMVIGFCEGDKELESVVMEIAPLLCMNSLDHVRSDESIQKKIADIKSNLDELHSLGFNSKDGVLQLFKNAIINLDGGAFPKGMLKEIAEQVKHTSLTPFLQLKGFSTADEIHLAVEEIRKMMFRVLKNVNIEKMFNDAGENEVGGPHFTSARLAAMGMLLSKLDISTQQRMANALTSTEASKMQGILKLLEKDMHFQNNTVYTDPDQREFLKNLLTDDCETYDTCMVSLQFALGTTLTCKADENADVNEGPALDIRVYLDEIWEQNNVN